MMLWKPVASLVVADVSGRCADHSRPILSRVLDATNHRGSSTKLVRGNTPEVRSLRSDRSPLRSQNVFLNFAGRSQKVRSKKEKVRSKKEEVRSKTEEVYR